MVKILMGLVAVVVIAVGGFFGFALYTQHRIEGDVETAFAQISAGGGKASHGKVSFDLKSRTLRIADIAVDTASQPPVSMKIAGIVASGVAQPDAGRFSATPSKCPMWKSAAAFPVRRTGKPRTKCRASS